MTKIAIFILFSLLGVSTIYSQEDEAEKELLAVKQITEITVNHLFLNSLAGDWKLMGLNHAGGESTPLSGFAVINSIMQNHYIEINLSVDKFGGSMTTRMLIGFDTRTNIFTLYSFDDVTNYSQYSTGTRSKDKIIFKGFDYNMKEKKELPYRIEIELERENKLTIKLFLTNNKLEFLNTEYQLIKKS